MPNYILLSCSQHFFQESSEQHEKHVYCCMRHQMLLSQPDQAAGLQQNKCFRFFLKLHISYSIAQHFSTKGKYYTTEKKKRSQLCIFTKKQSFSKKPVKSSNFLIIRLKVLQKDCQGKDLGKKGQNSKKGKLKLICTKIFKVWALG